MNTNIEFFKIRDVTGKWVIMNVAQIVDVYENEIGRTVIEMSNGRHVEVPDTLSEFEWRIYHRG